MKDWERIKNIRTDMSDYVMHCTRERDLNGSSAFDSLKAILRDGFLKATFAPRTTRRGNENPTVRGPHPAVCFTEQPLQFFIQSSSVNDRYREFAVAVRKDFLFYYGGRPVIYSNEPALWKLPDELEYLWVHYDPTVVWDNEYPIDWTHEREWRARPNKKMNRQIGLPEELADEVVPLHLPKPDESLPLRLPPESGWDFVGEVKASQMPYFVVLVDTEEHKQELKQWICQEFRQIQGEDDYWHRYSQVLLLAKERILSFERVRDSRYPYGRIEDFLEDMPNNAIS